MSAWPDELIEQIKTVNGLELYPLVEHLLSLRAV
jgi:hypothetical protein